jgi:SNF2 family DNA or RNA helicase
MTLMTNNRSREPYLDFSAPAEVVRVVVEGERLNAGHLFNPAFATETALIDPLPHQRLAVYDHMLPQARLRFLLADDAGAGKTIMAGLYIREMLTRRLVRRVLIVPPAGLVGNWEREMRTLFSLPFRVVVGSEARNGNPFLGSESNLLVVSVDTLAGERMFGRLQESSVEPYDLVIFDEAHKLAADREPDFSIRKTDRYRLAEALSGIVGDDERWQLPWSAHHLLLLTATPHMGKDYPYYCLWRLLEPEALATYDAFHAYPADARRRHFIRRVKEEMIGFDERQLYPERISDTLSYELTQGDRSEQQLYDETTSYIETYYNRARILNRSAARFAMSIFQRRLASSTFALFLSLKRREEKLSRLIEDIESGRLTFEELHARQRRLPANDTLDQKTADEESPEDDREENEVVEDEGLGGVVATSLTELKAEHAQVQRLHQLAEVVYKRGDESKFEKLREVISEPQYRDEKMLIFTEHRDTLTFLVRRLEGLGLTGQVAAIHGGLDYRERDEQVAFFKQPAAEGGAKYLVATDAAGEGINLQFCWLMINYDVPWNPARLEQRMGRIHRYGQKHDPVIILNLVAGKTREGKVLHVLLAKLERIRKELGSGKVFDIVGRLFEGVSIRTYMEQATTDAGAIEAAHQIEGKLTIEQVRAIEARDRMIYGDGGDVRAQLPQLKGRLEYEELRRLLPGYVRRFIESAAPLLQLGIEGDLDRTFTFRPLVVGALDPFAPALEQYAPETRERLTVYRPTRDEPALFLRPGEALFERLRAAICARYGDNALKGGVFVDPMAEQPYMVHLALVTLERRADLTLRPLAQPDVLEYRLVGVRQQIDGSLEECPVEYLLLLRGAEKLPANAIPVAATGQAAREQARDYLLNHVATTMAYQRRRALEETIPERIRFLERGYEFQETELAAARARYREKANAGDARAKGELTRIKERQRLLVRQRDEALAVVRREPELVAPGVMTFIAHALVVPSSDPDDRERYDADVEAIAVRVALAYEESFAATVKDVSTPPRARLAGLENYPGFDLYSRRPDQGERCIEVKGRAGVGEIEMKENEWAKACNLGDRYWLYVVFNCASPTPQLHRVQNPFRKLLAREKGGVIISSQQVREVAESEMPS